MRQPNPAFLWLDAATTLNAAAMTVAMRVFRMQQAMLFGDASGGPEARRMVSEKLRAAQKGYWAGVQSATALMLSPPASWWNGAAGVARATLRPGSRKARANARRLTKFR